jgi:hypothetical protein
LQTRVTNDENFWNYKFCMRANGPTATTAIAQTTIYYPAKTFFTEQTSQSFYATVASGVSMATLLNTAGSLVPPVQGFYRIGWQCTFSAAGTNAVTIASTGTTLGAVTLANNQSTVATTTSTTWEGLLRTNDVIRWGASTSTFNGCNITGARLDIMLVSRV